MRSGILASLLLILTVMLAMATTHHVPGDYATIQAGVDASAENDTVLVAAGTYTGLGNRDISCTQGIALIGEAGSKATTIDCEGMGRGFHIHTGWDQAATLSGFTIRNGYAYDGGGVWFSGFDPKLEDIRIQDCVATGDGGGLHMTVLSASISNCEISGCSADRGGGLYYGTDSPGPYPIVDVVIRNNTAASQGGGIYFRYSDGVSTLLRNTLTGNQPDALFFGPYVSGIVVQDCIIAFNEGDQPAINTGPWGWDVDFSQICSNLFGNAGGNYSEHFEDPIGIDGNIAIDPVFCDYSTGDLSLYDFSPCLPENNDCGVQMGALGLGCEPSTSISGRALTDRGVPMPGMEIHGPNIAFTDHDGYYTMLMPEGWSGDIVPSGWFHFNGFDPPVRSFVDASGNITDQDFTGIGRHICEIPADYSDIEVALGVAIDGDTLRVAPGTYYPQGQFGIDFAGKAVCLMSSDGPELTTIDFRDVTTDPGIPGDPAPEYIGMVFHSGEDSSTVVDGFSLTGVDSQFGSRHGYCLRCEHNSSPLLRNLIFIGNHSHSGGGLLSIESSPRVEDCVFISNRASWSGGGIGAEGGSLIVRRTLFESNSGNTGGGISLWSEATATIENVRFIDNTAHSIFFNDLTYAGFGGAVCTFNATGILSNCLLAENRSTSNVENASTGGAIYSGASVLRVESCTLVGNWDEGIANGGHLSYSSSQIDVSNSIFAFASEGGGIYQFDTGSAVDIRCTDVFGNVDGDYLGEVADQTGINGNISADPLFCDLEDGDYHLDAASPCLPTNNGCGVLMGALGEGCTLTSAPEDEIPARTFLARNHPNPFNPSTEISFGLPEAARVSLAVYDPQGRRVATLLDSKAMDAGVHTVSWRGRDNKDRPLPSGVYFYRLDFGNEALTGKMLMLE